MQNFYTDCAKILYDVAQSKGVLDTVYNDLQAFKQGVGGEMPFTQLMTREGVSHSHKMQLLNDISQYLSPEVQQFIQSFIVEAQYAHLYRGITAFEEIYKRHHLDIVTAISLSDEYIQKIIKTIQGKVNQRIDTYSNHIDPNVIGGVKVRMGDFVIDATLHAQLQAFRNSVYNN